MTEAQAMRLPRVRFTVRRMMLAVAVVAVVFALPAWVTLAPLTFGAFCPRAAWCACVAVAFGFVRVAGPQPLRPVGRAVAKGALPLVLAASLYVAWGAVRCGGEYWVDLGHGPPYPDRWIVGLERWYDARHPSPPDTLKLHGEMYRVMFAVGALNAFLAAACGCLAGLACAPSPEPSQRASATLRV